MTSTDHYTDLGSHGVLITKPELLVQDRAGNNNSFSWWHSTHPKFSALGLYAVMSKVGDFASGCMAVTNDFGDLVPVAADY